MNGCHLSIPLQEKDVRALHIGDIVYLSGRVFTGRSRIHRYIFDEGNTLPFDTADKNAMIHVGPIIKKTDDGWELVSFMPTSSVRFEKWGADAVEKWRLRLIVGKTTMGSKTLAAMGKFGCIHVSPQCVSPNLWRDAITISGVEMFDELGSIEASWQLELNELGPFIVDMDTYGCNYFDRLDKEIQAARRQVYERLQIPEDFKPTELY